MKKKLIVIVPLMIGVSFFGCDQLGNDVVPVSEELPALQSQTYTMPNTPVVFDLKKAESVKNSDTYRVSLEPSKGSLKNFENGYMTYVPDSSYLSGTDTFVMEGLNSEGQVMGSDSMQIVVVQDTSELPCFNGALFDYKEIVQNTVATIDILKNDGICGIEVAELKLEIVIEPLHGTLTISEDTTIIYTPELDFIGSDEFLYQLEITDAAGNIYESVASAAISVFEEDEFFCTKILYDDSYVLEQGISEYFSLYVTENDTICEGSEIYISESPMAGHAEVYTDQDGVQFIAYYIENKPNSQILDSLGYSVADVVGNTRTAKVTLQINGKDCMNSFTEDYFEIDVDSLPEDGTVLLDIFENDGICDLDAIGLSISEENDSEGAVAVVDKKIQYTAPDGVALPHDDTVIYKVCEDGQCLHRSVTISVIE
jgi:hypothetical protein